MLEKLNEVQRYILFATVSLTVVVIFDITALQVLGQSRFINHEISEFERESIFAAVPIVISFVISLLLGIWQKRSGIFSRFLAAVSCFAFPLIGAYVAITTTCKMTCP
ncbi:MAG TPA: hypothetical protein VG309_12205 [Rhizomicrobium sp.]|nr:hypothetical protein [Rhizomicrobium sp.]